MTLLAALKVPACPRCVSSVVILCRCNEVPEAYRYSACLKVPQSDRELVTQ